MSRVGREAIKLREGVTISTEESLIKVKGPKGELSVPLNHGLSLKEEDSQLLVTRGRETKAQKALHGLTVRLLKNAVSGVVDGFTKSLEVQGVGYKAAMTGKKLVLNLGFSHPVEIEPPTGIEIGVQKNIINVSGIDRQLVGQVAANIRSNRPPEPYKGKGIRYVGEHVRRKAGKAAKAAGAA